MNNLQKIFGAIAVVLYTIITIVPIVFALDRLILVSGFDPIFWVRSLDKNYVSQPPFYNMENPLDSTRLDKLKHIEDSSLYKTYVLD